VICRLVGRVVRLGGGAGLDRDQGQRGERLGRAMRPPPAGRDRVGRVGGGPLGQLPGRGEVAAQCLDQRRPAGQHRPHR
jgi:hypothetical protein